MIEVSSAVPEVGRNRREMTDGGVSKAAAASPIPTHAELAGRPTEVCEPSWPKLVPVPTHAPFGRGALENSAAMVQAFVDAFKHGAAALSVFDVREAVQLKPAVLERAGRLAATLRASGFEEAKVKQVSRALFCAHLLSPREAEQQMERAFDVWDERHSGVLELTSISHDLSALLAGDLEPHERQQLIDGLGADGSGQLEYEGFREVMRAIGADASERRGRLAALRLYGEDVGLARTALGAAQCAKLTRHQLRVAGAVVRVLQREAYRAEDAAALLPALGLPNPSETQLRAAFRVFDLGRSGGTLDGEYVRERLQVLVPQAADLVWGSGKPTGGTLVDDLRESFTLGAGARATGDGEVGLEPVDLLSYADFAALLAQLRQALASHALAAGVHTSDEMSGGWLSQLVGSVAHSATALALLKPAEVMLLPPPRLIDVGRVVSELEAAGIAPAGGVAIARTIFLPNDPEASRDAFLALDFKRAGAVPMARVRRLLPALSRHLRPEDAQARIAASLADVSDTHGLEQSDLSQLLASLRIGADGAARSVVGDALTGLASVDAATASSLSPLQLQRVGRIARRMRDDGYAPAAINTVIRVLFISSSRNDIERAFALLDKEHVGSLHADQFRQLLHVAGEHLPEDDELDDWFNAIDVDASGRLEIPEFTRLVRALRRAISSGHKTTLGTLTSALSGTVAVVASTALDPTFMSRLTPLERRRAGLVAEALHQAGFDARDVRTITRSLFDGATEEELLAAFAVFDKDGEGSLDGEEFREMLPMLAGDEGLPFARVEALFKQADKDKSGLIEFTEFVWLLANLNAGASVPLEPAVPSWVSSAKSASTKPASTKPSSASKSALALASGGSVTHSSDTHAAPHAVRYIKSVEELRADRLREAQQAALAERAARLRSKADLLARAASLLHMERPLVCAELLMRLHRIELEESKALRLADRQIPTETPDGLLLRGTPALLDRRAEVVLRALASLAVDERDRSLAELRQAIRSIDEELPVTETASHGIARCRGLHTRSDRLQLVVEVLGAPGGLAQASALVGELMTAMKEEADLLSAAPASITRGSEESLRAMRQRHGRFSQLQLMLHNEQVGSAKQHAGVLARQMRMDASRVTEFATQGVYVAPHPVTFIPIESAESVQTAARYASRWARCRALLVASEKVAQVLQLVRHGGRRSLQEGVQLLVTMEDGDMPTLFTIAREIMRATDAEQNKQQRKREETAVDRGHLAAASAAAAAAAPMRQRSRAAAAKGDGAKTAAAAPLPEKETTGGKTVWWHQIDDENDESYEVKDFSEWHATKDLRSARLHLMNNRATEGVASLEKLRSDLLLYARDAG